jgi:tetratricopeptide (TPR) repeat protein
MGVVYKARQVKLDRPVAVKVILGLHDADPGRLLRFRTEAQAMARLRHPHIVQVYEVGEQDGAPYFAMEYVDGGSLAQKLNGAPLPPRAAAGLVEAAARAMHYAHQQGVVHRDLKPSNVLLTADGAPKVTDFGLAKLLGEAGQTASGAVMGTPSYMPPEQAAGQSAQSGPLVDVYALGAILYECLTGRPPFRAATDLGTLAQVLRDDPVPPRRLAPATPRDLDSICLKCLDKSPGRRYATAGVLAEDLRRFLAGDPITARPVGALEWAAKWARRHRGVVWTAAVVGMAAFVALAVSTVLLWREKEATKAALARADAKNRWARRAVNDMYEEVAEKWLDHENDMTDVQLQFLHKAAEYYEELVREQSTDPAERLEAGIAYLRLAQLGESSGRSEEAFADFRRAIALFEGLAAEHPEEPMYRRQLACGYQALGANLRGLNPPEAEKYLLLSRPLFVDLARQFPDAPERQDDLAKNQENLGLLFEEMNRTEEAEAAFSEAIRIHKGAGGAVPRGNRVQVSACVGLQPPRRTVGGDGPAYRRGTVVSRIPGSL